MQILIYTLKKHFKEIVYQIAVIVVLGVLFSYNEDYQVYGTLNSLWDLKKFAFFGNYILAATIINYLLLPKFYYKKKEWLFCFSVIILITLVVLIDEHVLEQIYYPHTRGTYFPGILYTLIETLPIIIIAVAFKLGWDYNKKQLELEHLKTLVKESELQFLKNQINPHFLFNNLNNLYSHALTNAPQTPNIILELASVLRYMLYDCKENFVALSKEIDHLKHYTALNKLQMGQRGNVRFDVDLKSQNFAISPLVLVVFVENAFKYSTTSLTTNIDIDIAITVSETGLLLMHCTNNFSPEYLPKEHSGIGLGNVKKRLCLLYPQMHELDISIINTLYRVKLSMNLKSI